MLGVISPSCANSPLPETGFKRSAPERKLQILRCHRKEGDATVAGAERGRCPCKRLSDDFSRDKNL